MASSRLLEGHAPPGSNVRPNSKPRSSGLRPWSASASSNSSGARPRPPRRRLQRPRCRPPRRRPPRQPRGQHAAATERRDYSHLPDVVEDKVFLLPDQRRCSRCGEAVRRFPGHRGSHDPGDRRPGRSPSHSPAPLSTDLLVWCYSRHRHRPARPARLIPEEHAGGLALGDGALGQVSVLPADLSALGGLAQPRPGPSVGTRTHGSKRMVPLWSRCTRPW